MVGVLKRAGHFERGLSGSGGSSKVRIVLVESLNIALPLRTFC